VVAEREDESNHNKVFKEGLIKGNMAKSKHIGLWITLGIIVLVVLILVSWFIGSYNSFIGLSQTVDSKWSQVENQYQLQADKIPNLVSTVSSQVGVETKFVKDVIAERTAYVGAQSQLQKDTAGQQMNAGITAFVNAVSENYPTLQASEGYTALRDELVGSQNRIGVARMDYINSIQAYNTAIMRFPGNVLAGLFGFEQKQYYVSQSGTTTPVLGTGQLPQ
jgi:LemA protein